MVALETNVDSELDYFPIEPDHLDAVVEMQGEIGDVDIPYDVGRENTLIDAIVALTVIARIREEFGDEVAANALQMLMNDPVADTQT